MKRILVTMAAAGVAVAGLAAPAQADVSTNETDNDAWGYCVANHLANFNGTNHGIGWTRSEDKGGIADVASNPPEICYSTQGMYAPISNNG